MRGPSHLHRGSPPSGGVHPPLRSWRVPVGTRMNCLVWVHFRRFNEAWVIASCDFRSRFPPESRTCTTFRSPASPRSPHESNHMSKKMIASALGVVSLLTGFGAGQAVAPPPAAKGTSLYSFKTTALDGTAVDLASYKGKVVLVVNVASRCGYTPQYAELETVWKEFKDKGLVVIGFPCNDFGGQEPGSSTEIRDFCSKTYGVTFPMMSKVQTKAGEGQSEIYAFLSAGTGKLPSWNFGKYVVGKDGKPVAFYGSGVKPTGEELRKAIEQALAVKPVS